MALMTMVPHFLDETIEKSWAIVTTTTGPQFLGGHKPSVQTHIPVAHFVKLTFKSHPKNSLQSHPTLLLLAHVDSV